MAKPFKFRYVNEIVGGFVLLIVALLVAGVILAGHYQKWFTPTYTISLKFPPEGALNLKRGSDVRIQSFVVGSVSEIRINDDDSMTGVLKIKGKAIRFVRTDSKAIVKLQYSLFGDAYVEITRGKGPPLEDGGTLVAEKDTEITEVAQQFLNQFREATIPLLGQIRLTAEEYGGLAADLRDTNGPAMQTAANLQAITASLSSKDGPLMKILADVEAITSGLKNGDGTAGKLLRDPATADEINRILENVNTSLGQVNKILDDVKKTTAQLPPMAAKVGHEADDLPGLVLQTQDTITQARRLIEGIQQNWLIRGNIPQPRPTGLIPPSEVSVPAATGGKTP